MDFEFTDKQKMGKDTISKIMRREIILVASEYDRTKALFDSVILKDPLDTLVPFGYLSHVIPEEEGGWDGFYNVWNIDGGTVRGVCLLSDACGHRDLRLYSL